MTTVSMTAPTDYSTEYANILRQQKLAELMQQQSMQPLEAPPNTAQGWAVKTSPLSALAKMLQGYAGGKGQADALSRQQALGQKYQTDLGNTLAKALRAGTGSPEQYSGEQGTMDELYTPAQAPNREAMASILMQHPATQPLGMQQMGKDMENQSRAAMLAKIMRGAQGAGMTGDNSGTPFAGVPPEIVALMSSGDPELAKIGQTMMESSKGIAQRAGAPVVNPWSGRVIAQPTPAVPPGIGLTVGPQGPVASPVPGAQQAMAGLAQSQAGATEAGKAPYGLETLNTEGAPTVMTRQQAIEAATGKPMPQPSNIQQQMRVPPQVQAQRDGERMRLLQDELKANPNDIALKTELANEQQKVAGLRLQDQGASAQQRSYGTERGQLEAAKPQAAIQARTVIANLDRLNNSAAELETHPGLSRITGKIYQYPITDLTPEARAARALQGTLVKQAAVSTLQSMRDSSKSGGAVGQVTEKEWPILEQQLAALDAAQSTKDYQTALRNIQNQMAGAAHRIKSAYQETYKEPLQYETIPYVQQGRGSSGKIGGVRVVDW